MSIQLVEILGIFIRFILVAIAFGWLVWLAAGASLPGKISRFSSPAIVILLYLFLTNTWSYIIPSPYIFYLAYLLAMIILIFIKKRWPASPEREKIPIGCHISFTLLIFLAAIFIFTNDIHDLRCHYPLVSTISYGNLPVKDPTNPPVPLDYHYGFDLWAGAIKHFTNCYVEWAADWATLTLLGATVLLIFNLAYGFFQGSYLWAGGATILFIFGFGVAYLPSLHIDLFGFKPAFSSGSDSLFELGRLYSLSPIYSLVNHPYFCFILRRPVGLAYMLFALIWIMFFELCREEKKPPYFYLWMTLSLSFSSLASEEVFIFSWITLAAIYLHSYWRQKKADHSLAIILLLTLVMAMIQGGILTSFLFNIGTSFRQQLIIDVSLKWPPGFSLPSADYSIFSAVGISLLIFEFAPTFFLFPLLLYYRRGIFNYLLFFNYLLGFLIPLFFKFAFSAHDFDRLTFLSAAIANIFALLPIKLLIQKKSAGLKYVLVIILLLISISGTLFRVYASINFVNFNKVLYTYWYYNKIENIFGFYLPKNAIILADADLAQNLMRVGYFSIYPPQKKSDYFSLDVQAHEQFIRQIDHRTLKALKIQYVVCCSSSPLIKVKHYLGARLIASIKLQDNFTNVINCNQDDELKIYKLE